MTALNDFQNFVNNNKQDIKFYCNYQGIKRKEYPRWQGWLFIDSLKPECAVSMIDDPFLDCLVENFYLVMYLLSEYSPPETVPDSSDRESADSQNP